VTGYIIIIIVVLWALLMSSPWMVWCHYALSYIMTSQISDSPSDGLRWANTSGFTAADTRAMTISVYQLLHMSKLWKAWLLLSFTTAHWNPLQKYDISFWKECECESKSGCRGWSWNSYNPSSVIRQLLVIYSCYHLSLCLILCYGLILMMMQLI